MIVSNTTPLSNFLHLNRLDILTSLFSCIHIPAAVNDEIHAFFGHHVEWQTLLRKEFILVHVVRPHPFLSQLLNILHRGEAEAIALYLMQQARLCLLDDKDARIYAMQNDIALSGTFGILIEAKKKQIIPAAKPLLDELRERHYFWIHPRMYENVLELCKE